MYSFPIQIGKTGKVTRITSQEYTKQATPLPTLVIGLVAQHLERRNRPRTEQTLHTSKFNLHTAGYMHHQNERDGITTTHTNSTAERCHILQTVHENQRPNSQKPTIQQNIQGWMQA